MAADAGRGRSLTRKLPPALRTALRVVGVLWTLPNTTLGLIAGTAAIAFSAHAHLSRRELAVVFHGVPRFPGTRSPGGALTLGNTILHTGDTLDTTCLTYAHRAGHCVEPPVVLADHERAHVFQYMALGPLFLPVYFLCGGIGVRNRFERAADRYAATGRGWWPWPAPQSADG